MTMALMDLPKLRDQAHARGLVYDLEYYADDDTRTIAVFMVRHTDPDDPCFTLHDAATGAVIACDDTKELTESFAMIKLHQRADFGIPIRGLPG
jgi:hypothetical protein